MADQASQVKSAVEQVTVTANESSTTLKELTASADSMSGEVIAVGTRSQELASTAQHLRQLVSRFRLADVSTAEALPEVRELRRAA
jgi:methyl-accepting chemotaxis protein